ncbi:centrosomal protein of 126 kDa [Strix aluco]|uniref:centrosomal protein of 126 kDa n=1 Tax=Strix aluco TaxID=111821 RepID=UPI003DA42084
MEPSGKGGGAARRQTAAVYPSAGSAGGGAPGLGLSVRAARGRLPREGGKWGRGDLEEERRALKEDQKICRSRAQKYLIETNRRRRAFEERQKQAEEKEQRFRERVLQQRKIKLQEATGKFQRAHLPFSQHKQIVISYLLASRTTDDTSSSSASRNSSSHQKQISAMVGWDKTIQESSRTNMDSSRLLFQKNLKEMQHHLEKQNLSNLENFHQEVKKTDDSESLSSLDSLEAGEQNGNYTTPSESSLTTQCDCVLYNPETSQTRNNGLLYTAQSTSKNMHLNNCLRNVDLQYYHNLPIHDLLAKHNVLTPAEHVNNSEEESSASHRSGRKNAEFSTSSKQENSVSNTFSFLKNIKEERSKPASGMSSTLATGHPVFSPSKAWASPDSVPGERDQDLMQDQSFKMTPQKRTISVQTSSQPIATSIILFPNQGCSTVIPSTADTLPKDKNICTKFLKKKSGKMTETKEENIKCIDDINPGSSLFQDIPNASVLCEVKQQNNNEEEKGNMVETMSLVSDTEFNSGLPAQHKTLKNNILERKRAKLFRSILKKDSKYEPSHVKAVVLNHGISFGTRPMSSIRDSLELAKIKKKTAENEKYNRNLTWCDQINQIIIENNEKCCEKNTTKISSAQLQYVQTTNNAPKTNLSIVAQPSNPMFIKNHQENFHISKPNVNSEESNKECTSLNIFMSTGSFSAKKAWTLPKDEESKPPVCSNNSKINEGNQLKSKSKITGRTTSVRPQSSFMPKKRTGTIIQPQSAAEACKTRKASGKLLAPHPPSAPLLGNRSGGNTASPGCQPLPPSRLQATTTSRNDLIERHVVLADRVLNRNGTESSESITCRSDLATAISIPGCSMAKYKPWAKNTCSVSSVQTSACQDCSVTCTERRPVNAENGLYLHHTPAAGKTSTSWQGAHTARAPQDSAAGVVPVARQNQVFDNHENKHRAFSEHRRQSVASKRWKPTHHAQNSLCTVPLSPVQSAFDPVQNMNNTYKSDEESTVQFLMAEKLANTSTAEDEILAAMESVQLARQPLPLNRAPCPGMSALSVEEQKIFQSLDHLNQRLQDVQEAITRNPSASNVLQITTPLSVQQCISSPLVNTAIASQQYQDASANNRLRLYRRY